MSILENYLAGEELSTWQALLDRGDGVRDATVLEEASAVAAEAMARVRRNVERVHARLVARGYQFADSSLALCPADPDVETLIATFEQRIGPLPLALQAFYRELGAIDWRGEMPSWRAPGPLHVDSPLNAVVDESSCYADPLMVPPLVALLEECESRRDELEGLEQDEGLIVTFSPDFLGKVEGSGGLYGLLLPDAGLDTDLEGFYATTFCDYLRDALRWGGFPGLIHYQRPDIATVEALRADLESF